MKPIRFFLSTATITMSPRCRLLTLVPVLTWCLTSPAALAQQGPERVAWLTAAAVDRKLEQPLTASWKEISFRQLLKGLSRSQRVAIFLDRRVDPGQLVTYEAQGESMAITLARLTAARELGYCLVDSTVYIGPTKATDELATIAEVLDDILAQLPQPWKGGAAKRVAMKWEFLASPRDLISAQLQQAGIQVADPDSIPHDLWADQDLPPMPLAHRLTILLAGFDRAFTISGNPPSMSLLPMPAKVTLRRAYRKTVSTANYQRIREFFPDMEVTRTQNMLVAVGRQEDHRQLARLLRGEQVKSTNGGPVNKRYTMKVENGSIRQIIEEIARQDGLQIDIDAESRKRWIKLLPLDARAVTFEKLLEMTLSPAKLTGRLEGKKLIIRVAKEE
jgi:hypothetical protein